MGGMIGVEARRATAQEEPEAPDARRTSQRTAAAAEAVRTRATVDNSPHPTMFCDRSLTVTYADPAAIRALKGLERYQPIRASQMVAITEDNV